jgi:putative hemolysin
VTYITEYLFAYLTIPPTLGFPVGIAIGTASILIFGEIIPKSIARTHGERLLPHTLWLANATFYLFYPLVSLLMTISDFFVHRLDSNKKFHDGVEWISSEKELQFLIGYISDKGIMEPEKTTMLQNIFNLGETPVKQVLIPLERMVSVNGNQMLQDTIDLFLKYNYTRLPIYEGTPANIIGMVYLKDVFRLMANRENKLVKDIARPIMVVPESMKINALLHQFKQEHKHLAIVVGEHNSLKGLITLEDVLEEIVGDIVDEHEKF